MMGLGTAVGLAGCVDGEGSGGGGEDGHLRMSANRGLDTLSHFQTIENPGYHITGWLYSNLTRIDSEMEVHPDLATDWESNDEATEWEFQLRDDATFHYSGEQVTAEDVKASIETIEDPDVASPGQGQIGPIESVEAIDETTVQINLSGPYADLPVVLGGQYGRIAPKEAIEDDLDGFANTDYGSGPFVLEEFEAGNHVVVTAYDDYYMEDEDGNQLPYLDQVSIDVYPEPAGEVGALQNGETDVMETVPPDQWPAVEGLSGVDAVQQTGGAFANLVMRSDQPPFDDNRVREAFKYAVDREAILEGAYDGLGTVAQDHPISEVYAYHEELPEREMDRERARELLDEAGYGDGLELTLYVSEDPPVRQNVGLLIQDQLAEIGVDIDLQVVSYDRFISEVWLQAPFYVGYYGVRLTEDSILYLLLHSEGEWNEAHWHDDEFDELLESARSTTNEEDRAEYLADAQRVLQERGPFIIPFFEGRLSAKKEYVDNYEVMPQALPQPVERVEIDTDEN